MRLSLPLLAAVFSLASPAIAQLGIYGTFTAERFSPPSNTVATSTNLYSTSQVPAGVVNTFVPIVTNPIGGTGGVYYDFRTVGPVRLGADLRGSILTSKRGAQPNAQGAGVRINSVLGGVRGSFHTRYSALQPYVELAAGLGKTNYALFVDPTTDARGQALYNGFEFHGFAGLDIRLSSLLDVRAIELGYGGITSTGPAAGTGIFQMKSLGVGVVFHLPSLP